MGGGGELATSQRYYPALREGKGPRTQCIGGWVGHSTGLNRRTESRHHQDFYLRTVYPAASPYTD